MLSEDGVARSGLRDALLQAPPLLSTFVMIPRVEIIEVLAAVGYDAVVIDLEHGVIDATELPALSAAARGAGIFAIVRLDSSDPSAIGHALDAGVDGVIVPHVGSAEEARRIVAAGRFPPEGQRSLNPYVRGVRYDIGLESGRDRANESVALIAMIEGADGLRQLDAICRVDGLDAVFVGPVDLSASLGFPGRPEEPQVIEAVREILGRVAAHGRATSIYAHTPEAAVRWRSAGAALIALSADIAMAARGFASFLAPARQEAAITTPQDLTADQHVISVIT